MAAAMRPKPDKPTPRRTYVRAIVGFIAAIAIIFVLAAVFTR